MATAITGTDIRKAIQKAISPVNRKSVIGEYEYIGFKKLKGNKVKVTLFNIKESRTITVIGVLETIEIVSPKKGFYKVDRIRIEDVEGTENIIIKDVKMPEHTLCKLIEANPMTKLLESKSEYWLEPLR
jgi:hypothetical protein